VGARAVGIEQLRAGRVRIPRSARRHGAVVDLGGVTTRGPALYWCHRRSAMLTKLVLLFVATSATLPWREDNYAKAIHEAKSRRVPLFVEVWAPW
jgi:hypothetical protein